MELNDEEEKFQHGRQVSVNTGTVSVSIISTFKEETLDVIIEKALSIIDKIKKGS